MSRLACFMIVILTGAAGCAGSKREVSRFPMLTPKRVISSGEEARFAIGYDAAHDRLAIGKTCQLADGGGWEPGVVIIDFHTGRLTARLPVPPKRREQVRTPTGVIFSPSGDRLAVLWENGIDI